MKKDPEWVPQGEVNVRIVVEDVNHEPLEILGGMFHRSQFWWVTVHAEEFANVSMFQRLK